MIEFLDVCCSIECTEKISINIDILTAVHIILSWIYDKITSFYPFTGL